MNDNLYQLKPAVVQARRYLGGIDAAGELAVWCGGVLNIHGFRIGDTQVARGSWVVKHADGQVEILSEANFEARYERPAR